MIKKYDIATALTTTGFKCNCTHAGTSYVYGLGKFVKIDKFMNGKCIKKNQWGFLLVCWSNWNYNVTNFTLANTFQGWLLGKLITLQIIMNLMNYGSWECQIKNDSDLATSLSKKYFLDAISPETLSSSSYWGKW